MTHQRPSKFTRSLSSESKLGSLKLLRPSLSWSMTLRQCSRDEEARLPSLDKVSERELLMDESDE